jgi:IMP dehydrogenase/GMP reductase
MRWYGKKPDYLYTFDDVLIRPSHSSIKSRLDANPFFIWECNNKKFHVSPIIAANMSTIATIDMYKSLAEFGMMVPFHRFQSIEDQLHCIQQAESFYYDQKSKNTKGPLAPVSATIGLDRDRTKVLIKEPLLEVLFLELAHADCDAVLEEAKFLKDVAQEKCLIIGNVATEEACETLVNAGFHGIKLGVGCGSLCSTRIITGCGVPQLYAIDQCADYSDVIADGGIRHSGDIMKCLAAGAAFVMIGSLFAGTDETGQDTQNGMYLYKGMASKDSIIDRYGKEKEGIVPEGISAYVPYRGSAKKVAKDLLAGIRQGLTMAGTQNILDFQEKAVFQWVSGNTIEENSPHIANRKGTII